MISRGIRAYMAREWRTARAAKDAYWAERIARYGPLEGLRIADELRRQALLHNPGWPDAAFRKQGPSRSRTLGRAVHPCRFHPPQLKSHLGRQPESRYNVSRSVRCQE